jgi:GNAT superfamily N-acetyltransferase
MEAVTIVTASSPEQFAQARRLFEDYQRWLGIDLSFQDFSGELDAIARMYGPPAGALLLASQGRAYVGCVALRPLEGSVAEMKRMFVPEAFRGRGIGRALAQASVSVARDLGYSALRLDTIPRLGAALALYKALGFVEIAAYRHNPVPDAIFLELRLR